jgi:hypothetical protein
LALHWAAASGQGKATRALVQLGADKEAKPHRFASLPAPSYTSALSTPTQLQRRPRHPHQRPRRLRAPFSHLPHSALCSAFQCCTWHALEQYCGPLQRPHFISCAASSPQLEHSASLWSPSHATPPCECPCWGCRAGLRERGACQ